MNESQRLARQLDLALNGGAWHGPSWREVLEKVTPEAAVAKPVPEGHSIAEVVLHAATWQDVVRRRLQGETPQVSDEEDWPSADGGAAWWKKTQARLFETGAALTKTVEQFPAERLHENRPGLDDTWYGLIIGQLQHGLYHLGQAAVLGKAGSRK